MNTANNKEWPHPPGEKYLTYGLIILLIALVVATILLGSVPPVDRDGLTHHLFVPKRYLQHGGIYEIPEITPSYYPMNLDLLYMIPLYLGNDIAPKYIHYLFALLTSSIIFNYLKRRIGIHYALLGSLFFLSIPIIIKLSITVYVDLGLVFFTTASLLLLFHWAEKDYRPRFLILAGLCCGLAAGTKYNGLISIFILTLFVPIIYQQSVTQQRQNSGKALVYGLVFFASSLLTFSPWAIRNHAWTGNPIYPLYDSLFQQRTEGVIEKQSPDLNVLKATVHQLSEPDSNAFTSRKILYHETWWQALLLPIRFFYEGQDDNPQFFDGKLSPFLLLLPILAFLIKTPVPPQQKREKNILLCFVLLYFFIVFFQYSLRIRYIVPIVPSLVILSMYGLQKLFNALSFRDKGTTSRRNMAFLLVAFTSCTILWYNTNYIISQFKLVKPLQYLSGEIDRSRYITLFRPEYPAIEFANAHLPPNTKVLCLFLGNRGYYMDFQPVFELPGSYGPFTDFLNIDDKKNDLKDRLMKNGLNYLLLRNDFTQTWFQQLNEEDKEIFALFFQNDIEKIYINNGHTIFRLKK